MAFEDEKGIFYANLRYLLPGVSDRLYISDTWGVTYSDNHGRDQKFLRAALFNACMLPALNLEENGTVDFRTDLATQTLWITLHARDTLEAIKIATGEAEDEGRRFHFMLREDNPHIIGIEDQLAREQLLKPDDYYAPKITLLGDRGGLDLGKTATDLGLKLGRRGYNPMKEYLTKSKKSQSVVYHDETVIGIPETLPNTLDPRFYQNGYLLRIVTQIVKPLDYRAYTFPLRYSPNGNPMMSDREGNLLLWIERNRNYFVSGKELGWQPQLEKRNLGNSLRRILKGLFTAKRDEKDLFGPEIEEEYPD